MELQYIKNGASFKINQYIPGSETGDTVTIQIRRNSDGYYWDFTELEWSATSKSGTMTFDFDAFWYASFTPSTSEDSHNILITWEGIKYTQVLRSVAQATVLETSGTDLTTLASVKEYLGIKSVDNNSDAVINTVISNVSKLIKNYCGRDLVSTSYTEYYNGNGKRHLRVKQYPITEITEINDDDDNVWDSTTEIVLTDVLYSSKTSGAELANLGIVALRDNVFSLGLANIKISYTAGYSSIPSDLELAAKRLVGANLKEGKENGLVISVQSEEDTPKRLREIAMQTVELYRRIDH